MLLPFSLVVAGLSVLLLASSPGGEVETPGFSEVRGSGTSSGTQLQGVNEIRPQMANTGTDELPRDASPPRTIRQPAPVDAMPVTRAQPISGDLTRPPSSARQSDNGPLQVAVVSHVEDPQLVSQTLAALRTMPGVQAFESSIETIERPDVLLILDGSSSGASVWYCGPSPNESSTLAAAVLSFVSPLGAEPGDAIGAAVDESLSCSTLHAGRARMAAVNLRLPVDTTPSEELARIVTQGVRGYLDGAEARIRRNRMGNEVTWPAYGPITSHYGPDHALGIDIGQWEGDVVSATDGFVTFAGGDACCSYGLYVIVESPNGMTTLYGHLDALYVQEGDAVRAGRPLGPVGNTGHSSGTHLHFETLVNGVRVNPLSVLP